MNRVIRACNEMGDRTLVEVIHDQGAGGPANVLKELVEKSGGFVEIRNIIQEELEKGFQGQQNAQQILETANRRADVVLRNFERTNRPR